MTRINTNISSLSAQKSLAQSNVQLQEALTRLSTGLRINAGKDDPAGLIASEVLRADIISIEAAVSNSERANQMIATADSALGQVSSLLNDIRGLVTAAANSGALSDEQIAANQLQVDSSLEAINRIAQTTSFQGRKLLDGSLDFITTTADADFALITDLQIDQANLGATGQIDVEIDVTTAATQGEITTDVPDSVAAATATVNFTTNVSVGDSLDINAFASGAEGNKIRVDFVHTDTVADGEIVATYSYDEVADLHYVTVRMNDNPTVAYTLAELETAMEGVTDNNGAQVLAVTVNDGGGGTTYDSTAAEPTTQSLTGGADAITGLEDEVVFELRGDKGSEVFQFDADTTGDQIADAVNLVSDATGVTAAFDGTTLTLTSVNYGTNAYVEVEVISEGDDGSFEDGFAGTLRSEGEDIEATVNGYTANGDGNTLSINTATLDLTATIEADQTGTISFSITGGGAMFQVGPDVVSTQQARIGIFSLNTGKLGGSAGRLYQLNTGGDATLADDPTTAAEIVDQVISKVASLRGRLGAFQRTTIETNINALNDTMESLTAAESSIRDADFAAESAALTRAQILVQSGTSVLAIANTSPQNVLALLR